MREFVNGCDLAPGMIIDGINLIIGETLWLGVIRIDEISGGLILGTRVSNNTEIAIRLAPTAMYRLAGDCESSQYGEEI